MDGFIRSGSAEQPAGEQDVQAAAAAAAPSPPLPTAAAVAAAEPDTVKSHRQRCGGQEQSE